MLNVTESNNGKLNIILTEGFKSELHNHGKVKAKIDLISDFGHTKNTSQKKLRHVKKSSKQNNLGLKAKQDTIKPKDKPKKNVQPTKNIVAEKSEKTCFSNEQEIATFVTKNELDKLKENLIAIEGVTNLNQEDNKQLMQSKENINETVEENENIENSKPPTLGQSGYAKKDDFNEVVYVIKETEKPLAMRSSFAIGAPGLVIHNPQEDKVVKHRQWVKELEQQIQENKERKTLKENNFSFPKSQNKDCRQDRTDDTAINSGLLFPESQRGMDKYHAKHVRGRGLNSMLPEKEDEKHKQKILEHQKAIERQVEDRRQQKMKERQRQLREEKMEEERLEKEREKMQKQFEQELIKTKEKEEQAKRRAQILQEGLTNAFESAQQVKRDKRNNRIGNCEDVYAETTTAESNNPQKGLEFKEENNAAHTLKPTRNSLLSENYERPTSSSEGDKDLSQSLINKWMIEDFNGLNKYEENEERHFALDEYIVPFHRTESAILSLSKDLSQSNDEHPSGRTTIITNTTINNQRGKNVKQVRSKPEIQTTRTSRLRQKLMDTNSVVLVKHKTSRKTGKRREIVDDFKAKSTCEEINDDKEQENFNDVTPNVRDNQMTNIPSHLLAIFAPTAHQEKILLQLAQLRKGLLIKDQEIENRALKLNEY